MAARVKYIEVQKYWCAATVDSTLFDLYFLKVEHAILRKIYQNDTKNNSTAFCGLRHNFNDSESLLKVPNIYIADKQPQ
jgi:hypothetical protein